MKEPLASMEDVAHGLEVTRERDDGLYVEELGLHEGARTLSAEWPTFRRHAVLHGPFLRPDVLSLWAEMVGSPDQCRVVTARRGGELVGVGPFMVAEEAFGPLSVPTLRFIGNNVGCPGDLTYVDIAAASPRARVVRAILEHAARWRVHRWDLGYVVPASETCALAREVLGASPTDETPEPMAFVSRRLPHNWDDFLGDLSGDARRNFHRRLRRMSEIGPVSVQMARSPGAVRGIVQEMIRNHERWYAGTDREGWLGDESVKRFLVEAARLLAADNAFLAFALKVNGEPIAWNVGAYDHERYFEWIASFDRSYRACAPGVLLGMRVIQYLIELGAAAIELGPGFDERKRRLGGVPTDFPRLRGSRGWVRAAATAHRVLRRRKGPT